MYSKDIYCKFLYCMQISFYINNTETKSDDITFLYPILSISKENCVNIEKYIAENRTDLDNFMTFLCDCINKRHILKEISFYAKLLNKSFMF